MAKKSGCKPSEIKIKGRCISKKMIKLVNEYVGVVNTKAVDDAKVVGFKSHRSSVTGKRTNWVHGKIPINKTDYYDFEAKVYNEPTKYGIKNGRISKLQILRLHAAGMKKTRKQLLNYDRGWDVKTDEGKKVMSKILDMFPVVDPEDL